LNWFVWVSIGKNLACEEYTCGFGLTVHADFMYVADNVNCSDDFEKGECDAISIVHFDGFANIRNLLLAVIPVRAGIQCYPLEVK
jgi:hypothetical protein